MHHHPKSVISLKKHLLLAIARVFARAHVICFISTGFPNVHADTKLTANDATDAKKQVNSMSPRPESNARRPGPGFGQQVGKTNFQFYLAYPSNLGKVATLTPNSLYGGVLCCVKCGSTAMNKLFNLKMHVEVHMKVIISMAAPT